MLVIAAAGEGAGALDPGLPGRAAKITSISGSAVDLDLEKFFDRAGHDIRMARVARKVADQRVLALIGRFLRAGVRRLRAQTVVHLRS